MASILSLRPNKYADEPVEHIESAGEILIKKLVQKQTNTHITLDQHLKNEKLFEPGVGIVYLDELGSGSITLQDFEQRKSQAENVRELESRELKRRGSDPLLHPETTPNQIQCGNRQERELALSVKPNSIETRLYQFAINNESRSHCDVLPHDHPIHQLADMERALVSTADPITTARTIRRKRKQQLQSQDEIQVRSKPPVQGSSLWDAVEPPCIVQKRPCLKTIKKCEKQVFYTIKDGKIMKLEKCLEETPKTVPPKTTLNGHTFITLQNSNDSAHIPEKLSEEEIRQLPRFHNYDQGKESKVLYIKNLSASVTEADIAEIFGQFQKSTEERIVFRVMSGKMRGQAFITFNSCDTATEALKAVNGTILKGKPIVIQYGKHQ